MIRKKFPDDLSRLPPPRRVPIIQGPFAGLALRPWFDAVAVRFVTDWFVPVSRAWAVAVAADGDRETFVTEIGPRAERLRMLDRLLPSVAQRAEAYKEASAEWETAFFGAEERSHEALVKAEVTRSIAADAYAGSRFGFLPLRRHVPQVKWTIDPPEIVRDQYGDLLENPAAVFAVKEDVQIEISRFVAGPQGREGWIRTSSPVLGDQATARVFLPEGQVRGAVVWLHGVGLEPEMWVGLADPVNQMLQKGFCVIQPEGPWHGRRTPPGAYGGELVFAHGAAGFIDVFRGWAAEVAIWCGWARREFNAPVAVGGISLGALTSQMVVSVCGHWPEENRPDACLLVTTTNDVIGGALNGALAQRLKLSEALSAAGWEDADLRPWKMLIEPWERPAIPPEKIVMLLGSADTITPYAGGKAMADSWKIPAENLFVLRRGHFSGSLGLYRNPDPLWRLADILTG